MKKLSLVFALFLFVVGFTMAQRSVMGTLTDNSGEALIGANILVKGTTVGTVTDIDGKYTITVPEGSNTLVFSYTGFETQEVELGASNVLDLTLSEGVSLTEVVITALGIEREKKALGYAVSTVEGSDIEQKGDSDVTRLLKGKVSGVNITSTSGVSGTGTNIIIRGYTSITGDNQPLFIVDGVPFNTDTNNDNGTNDFLEGGQATSSRFLDLDPNNIENISVLKGLSASVTYGERGRNGVILITTKNGGIGKKKGETFSISLNQSYYTQKIGSLPDYQSNFGGGFHQNVGFFFSNWGPNFNRIETVVHPLAVLQDESLKAQFPEFQDATYEYKNYDSVENFFNDGHVSNTSVSISAGSENASFSTTFGYNDDSGFVPNNTLKKINFGVGGAVNVSDRLTINSTFNYVKTDMETPPISYGNGSGIGVGSGISVFSDVFYTPRSVDLLGLPFVAPADGRSVYYRSGNDIQNPRWTAEYSKTIDDVRRFYGQTGFKLKITNWLNVNYRIGLDTYTEDQSYILNKGSVSNDNYTGGLYRTVAINSTIWDHNAYLNFNKDLTEDIGLNANVGFNYREDKFNRDGIESVNQLVFGFIEHSNFTSHSSVNSFSNLDLQTRSDERLAGAYGELSFDYKDYLYLNIAGRNDWSSTVEDENASLFYPSVSLSFLPTEIMTRNDYLTFLKLRVGYGTSAGFPGTYATRNTLNSVARRFVDRAGNVITGNSNATYFDDNGAGATLGNPNLKPELQKELEFGFESRLFKNKLGLDFTFYTRTTQDLITSAPLDPSTGFTSTRINIGEIKNDGIEIGLDATPLTFGDFSWNIAANFYTYKSKVTDLGADLDEVGIAGFSNLGNFAIKDEAFGIMKGSGIQKDDNGNPIIDADGYFLPTDEIQIIGDPNPDFTTAITNTFRWKGLSLSIQYDWKQGGDIYSGTARALLARGLSQDTDFDRTQAFVLDGVTAEGEPNQTMITATNLYFDNYGFGPSELSVFDATVFRLRDVSLSYSLPASLLSKTPIKGVTLTLSGQNLWFFAPGFPEHTNVDPDALGFGAGGNGLGFEFLNGPSVKRLGGALKIRF